MEATSPRVIQAYEERIDALEHKKLIAQEKSSKTAPAPRSFDEVLELTMLILSNPQKLWAKGSFEAKRTLLKLAFSSPITYRRKSETRTHLKAALHMAFTPFLGLGLQDGADGGT